VTSWSLACAAPVEEGSLRSARQTLVTAFIEKHLRDPDLKAASVAEGLRISPRYLRKLMEGRGETASGHILRRRLEECAREFSSVSGRARSITDVAFAWGFNSTAHFARVFKSKYGVTPRDFRLTQATRLGSRA
jgi:AraC-like DNA-binding protein